MDFHTEGADGLVWPGGVMVRALDLRLKGRRFDPRPFRFQVTTLGKLFTHKCFCHQAVNLVSVEGR